MLINSTIIIMKVQIYIQMLGITYTIYKFVDYMYICTCRLCVKSGAAEAEICICILVTDRNRVRGVTINARIYHNYSNVDLVYQYISCASKL